MHTHTASRLLDNSEALERGGRKLNIGQRLLAETEGVGAAVLEDLSRQRETLQNARAKVIAYLLGQKGHSAEVQRAMTGEKIIEALASVDIERSRN